MRVRIPVTRAPASRAPDSSAGEPAFGTTFSDHMLVAAHRGGGWTDVEIRPYGTLSLPPAVNALQYGLAVFEGLKAFRTVSDDIVLFRPRENHERLRRSCRRLALPEVPEDLFLEGLRQLVGLDAGWVPETGGGSLYVRPCVFAVDENIRVKPADSCLFVTFTCPVGRYFAEPLSLVTTDRFVRAFPGGTGDVKPAGNYAAAMLAEREAQLDGHDGVLWLDAREHRYVEECGVMNVFFAIEGKVVTPALSGTVLAGVTRDSVIWILREMGVTVEERALTIDEVVEAHEAGTLTECFGTGTAATVAHVDRITHQRQELRLPPVELRRIAPAVLERLNLIRTGRVSAPVGWLLPVRNDAA
jgi:branched-chain amino acid aminotransferase